jgi:hypothetical protein
MTRNIYLSCLFLLSLLTPVAAKNHSRLNLSLAADTVNIKKFGAVGDGKADDYKAFLALANYVNSRKGGIVYFPKGNYYIAEYHKKDNKFSDIVFTNCNNLELIGDKAVILLNGKFNRAADKTSSRHSFSLSTTIVPIAFENCSNVKVRGFEINGGVQDMTRDSNVMESGGYLLRIAGCTNVEVRDMYLHHAHTDGVVISRNNGVQSSNIKMYSVVSSNNARQGMSIGSLINGTFNNCKFINTGFTDGNYKFHAPGAGVDIEPADETGTKGIVFNSCLFENNTGGQFLCSSPKNSSDIVLNNCIVNAKNSKSRYQLILAAKNVTINQCQINCENGNVYATWDALPGSSVLIKNSEIKSRAKGIIASNSIENDITIQNNTITFTGSLKQFTYFPYLQAPNMHFLNNKIFIPSAITTSKKINSIVQNAKESTGNTFYSESPTVKPKVSYLKSLKVNDTH